MSVLGAQLSESLQPDYAVYRALEKVTDIPDSLRCYPPAQIGAFVIEALNEDGWDVVRKEQEQ